MSDMLERARRARQDARATRVDILLRTASAHDRMAVVSRSAGLLFSASEYGAATCFERARDHQIAALALRRRARWLTDLRLTHLEVTVHLGFLDVSCREDVLALLHDLGPWEGGDLIDLPNQGAYFRIASDDPVMSEIAVRERMRVALASLGGWESLVTLHTVSPRQL